MKLTISNISKSFKTRIALQNISFELQPGIYGLLGPNGAGKTSLMKIIADIMVPTSGQRIRRELSRSPWIYAAKSGGIS